MPENTSYVIRGDDDVEYGPVDLAGLREWVVENRAGLGTSVRLEADEHGWSAWQNYPELVALLAEVRATGGPASLPVLAPFGRRALAFIADFFMTLLIIAPLVVLLYCLLPSDLLAQLAFYSQSIMYGLSAQQPPLPLWFQAAIDAVMLLVPIVYYGCFHAYMGRTPAKAFLQLQVVDAEGNKPRLDKSLLRAFVFAVCVFYLLGIPLLFAFLNPQRRALHDIVAGTYVVES